jgi:hypothetical protein
MDIKDRGKLGPQFYGPFKILERVGNVVYKLQLSAGARLHDVFHVGVLKRFTGTPPDTPGTLPPLRRGRACLRPEAMKKSRVARGRVELLVHWVDRPATEASWMDADEFRSLYPDFQLEDELLVKGGEMSCLACTTPDDTARGESKQGWRRQRGNWKNQNRTTAIASRSASQLDESVRELFRFGGTVDYKQGRRRSE